MATVGLDATKAQRPPYALEVGLAVIVAAVGAVLGAAVGGVGGAVAGGVIGAGIGALIGWALAMGARDADQRDRRLDRAIGVDGGELGVPGLKHPPATVGTFSREASGASGGSAQGEREADGPIEPPPT